jgi:hypothetical protein
MKITLFPAANTSHGICRRTVEYSIRIMLPTDDAQQIVAPPTPMRKRGGTLPPAPHQDGGGAFQLAGQLQHHQRTDADQ